MRRTRKKKLIHNTSKLRRSLSKVLRLLANNLVRTDKSQHPVCVAQLAKAAIFCAKGRLRPTKQLWAKAWQELVVVTKLLLTEIVQVHISLLDLEDLAIFEDRIRSI
jgi:hypothetical protein